MMATVTEYSIGAIDRIPLGEGREFDINGTLIAVFRTRSGGIYATQAACPHRGGPLADGIVGGSTVVCPFHNRRFDLSTGESDSPASCTIETYAVRVDEGQAYITVDSD